MCKFFSFVMDKNDNIYYLDKEQRKQCIGTNDPDSHAYICEVYHLNEDDVNKYHLLKKLELEIDNVSFIPNSFQKNKLNNFIKNIDLKKLVYDSKTAYIYCKEIKNDPIIRNMITESFHAFLYCLYVADNKSIRNKIKESYYARRYCIEIKDREEIRAYITNQNDVKEYYEYYKKRNTKI